MKTARRGEGHTFFPGRFFKILKSMSKEKREELIKSNSWISVF